MDEEKKKYSEAELHLAEKLEPIRLALRIAESLLSRGVSTRDTVSQALDVTERYCKERVYFDVSSNVITASQYRGLYKDPLTLMVTVRYDASNNMRVQELQQLVRDIVKGMPLRKAIKTYEEIEKSGPAYPTWLRTIGNAGMAAGVTMLFTDSWINILLTFIAGCFVDIFLRLIERRHIPPFFTQALAAIVIVLIAAVFVGLGNLSIWPFTEVNPTMIVVGGIMMLVAGLTLAAMTQDAIDEYYVTAAARIVKTAMMTIGIIIGILVGLTLVSGISGFAVDTGKAPALSPYIMQVFGAAIAAAAWALHTQSSRAAIAWSAIISSGGYLLYTAISPERGDVFASGIASLAIGFLAAIVARFWKSPSIAIKNSAVLILLPGFMLYRGLMHFVGETTPEGALNGIVVVVTATGVALAISAGAALGTYIGRPVRSHMVRLYKYAPQLFTRSKSKD